MLSIALQNKNKRNVLYSFQHLLGSCHTAGSELTGGITLFPFGSLVLWSCLTCLTFQTLDADNATQVSSVTASPLLSWVPSKVPGPRRHSIKPASRSPHFGGEGNCINRSFKIGLRTMCTQGIRAF